MKVDDAQTPEVDPLSSILDSRTFQRSPKLQALLEWLWLHQDREISQYEIATEVLGQPSEFDPAIDATVRVHISRLRQKLKEFYEDEGKSCRVRASIPLGSYQLEIEENSEDVLVAEEHSLRDAELLAILRKRLNLASMILAVTILVAVAVGILFWVSPSNPGWSLGELPVFWQRFLANRKPVRLIIEHPILYRWQSDRLVAGDFGILRDKGNQVPEKLGCLVEAYGSPGLYMSMIRNIDTVAAVQLTRRLAEAGVGVTLDESETMIESVIDANVICLGSVRRVFEQKLFARQTSFRPVGRADGFYDVRGGRGVHKVYQRRVLTTRRKVIPGLIALLPPGKAGTNRLVIAGEHTAGLVAFLFSESGSEAIEDLRTKNGSPKWFEVLVQQEADGTKMISGKPMILRSLTDHK